MPSPRQTARRARNTARLRRWEARARRVLAAADTGFELDAPHGVTWDDPPLVELTRHPLGDPVSPAAQPRLALRCGPHVHLGRTCTFEVLPGRHSEVVLHDGVVFGTAIRLVLFGGRIEIGPWSRVRDGCMLKSSGRMRFGSHLILSNHSLVHCAEEIDVGDHAAFAERLTIIDSDHLADGSEHPSMQQPVAVSPIRVDRNVWIGANVILLRGATLGPNSIVAAGSVVRSGEYPGGHLIAGHPAVVKRKLPGAAES